MNRFFFFVSVSIFCLTNAKGQSLGELVGVMYGSPSYKFSSLDLSTKADSVLATIGNAGIYQGNSTYDIPNNRYFGKNGTYIYSIDPQTGTLWDSFPGLNTFNGIEYDEFCSCLDGIYVDLSTNTTYFASLDLTSQVLNKLSTVISHANYFGESTFDNKNRRYFRVDQNAIEVYDNLGDSLDLLPRTNNLSCLEYDPNWDRIIGYYFGVTSLIVASIDVSTHQFNVLDSVQMSSSCLSGESTFDKTNQRYFFKTVNEVYAYDLQNSIFNIFPNALLNTDGIEYKEPPPKPVVTTGNSEFKAGPSLMVYPNPGNGEFTFSNITPGSRLKIYNTLGQTVYEGVSETANLEVNLENRKPGIYFYELTLSSGQKIKNKLILK